MESMTMSGELPSKLPKWRARLSDFLVAEMQRGFVYGQSDCALFAAGAVHAMTGFDPAARWRGQYSTLRGGLRLIKAAGFRDHIAATSDVLDEIAVGAVQVGDIAMIDGIGGQALGVVTESGITVRPPGRGLGTLLRTEMKRAFKCG